MKNTIFLGGKEMKNYAGQSLFFEKSFYCLQFSLIKL
jgi:hypothetical protein